MHHTCLVQSLVCLALATPSAALAQSFDITPADPTATDPVAIQARYTSPCPGEGGRVEVQGDEIALFAVEDCDCSPFAHAENVVTLLAGPLPPGPYAVQLFVEANAQQGCAFEPRFVSESSFAVGAADLTVATDPPAPVAGSPTALVVRHRCPLRFEGATLSGREIRVLGATDPLTAQPPCAATPSFESRLALGTLEPGPYTALVFTEAPAAPQLAATASFEVGPGAPAGELLLLDGRFRVTASWRTPAGAAGPGRGVGLTDQSGAFWFFAAANLEIFVKLLDGCEINDRYWVFASGLTNVEVDLRVEDLVSGAIKTYHNPLGQPYEPALDTLALPCSP